MRQYFLVNSSFSARVREIDRNGRKYLLADAVGIVPGVLNGSKGALYYPIEDIAESAPAWIGKPLTNMHPIGPNGSHVSVNFPGVLEKQGIGEILTAKCEGKLKHVFAFDVENTRAADKRYGTDIYGKLMRGETIELSTGLFTDNEEIPGTFNGRPYDAVARNYQPDHMAILDRDIGACSRQDGCGVLVNKKKCPECGGAMKDGECEDCEYVENAWTEAAREAAAAARAKKGFSKHFSVVKGGGAKPSGKQSPKQQKASKKAEDSSRKAEGASRSYYDRIKGAVGKVASAVKAKFAGAAAVAHNVAQSYHQAAADLHRNGDAGDKEWAAYHDAKAKEHGDKVAEHEKQKKAHAATRNDANFASEAQRKYLWSQEPDIAESWAHGEHTAEDHHRMPGGPGKDVKGPMAKAARKRKRVRNTGWTDEARAAAAAAKAKTAKAHDASMSAGHSKAMRQTLQAAKQADEAGDHTNAAVAHKALAKMHMQAGNRSQLGESSIMQHYDASKAHKEAAMAHQKVASMTQGMSTNSVDPDQDCEGGGWGGKGAAVAANCECGGTCSKCIAANTDMEDLHDCEEGCEDDEDEECLDDCLEELVGNTKRTIFERLANFIGLNAYSQPRHPRDGTFQGTFEAAARRSKGKHPPFTDPTADAALIGEDNDEDDDGRDVDALEAEPGAVTDELHITPEEQQRAKGARFAANEKDAKGHGSEKHGTSAMAHDAIPTKDKANSLSKYAKEMSGRAKTPGKGATGKEETEAHIDHSIAAEAHKTAGDMHLALAKGADNKADAQKHAAKAADHYRKEDSHREAVSKIGALGNNISNFAALAVNCAMGGPTHGQATLDAAHASLTAGHPEARNHAMAAVDAGDDHEAAHGSHIAAAKAHEGAATAARKAKEEPDDHDRAAALHRKAASLRKATMNRKENPVERKQMEAELIASGEEAAVINKLSDRSVQALFTNLKAQGSNADVSADSGSVRAGQVGTDEWDKVDRDELADCTDEGGDAEVDFDDDEELVGKVKGKEKKKVANMSELLKKHGSAEDRAAWNQVLETAKQQKIGVVKKLISNLQGKERRAEVGKRLMGKSMIELQEMLELRGPEAPVDNSENILPNEALAIFGGDVDFSVQNTRTPAANAQEDLDMVPPVIDFRAEQAERLAAERAKQSQTRAM